MTAALTIVMYHYVRDVEETLFPDIKALSTEQFRGQLDYIESQYQLVKLEEVREAATGSENRPHPAQARGNAAANRSALR